MATGEPSANVLTADSEAEDILREIFMTDGSDEEFLGFDLNDGDSESDSDDDNTRPNNGDGDASVSTNVEEFVWEEGGTETIDKPSFTGQSGFTNDFNSTDTSFLGFFGNFVKEEDFGDMATETNRYASAYFQKKPKESHSKYSQLKQWVDVSASEMKAFIAIIFAMGLIYVDDIKEYWSTHQVMSIPFFSRIMPRARFMNILSFFHLADNSTYIPKGQDGYNPLHKLGAIYERVITRFQGMWTPRQNVSIDEAMVPFRGQIHFRVYNKDKPNKYGIKAYELCDSSNGYCSRFEMYTGIHDAVSQFGKTYDLVMRLMAPYLNQGYCLFVDNFYTSPTLLRHLLRQNTLACGTLRMNRKGVPADVANAKLKKKGDKVAVHCGQINLLKMKDRKVFAITSTAHSLKDVDTNRVNPVTKEKICVPEVVNEYNKNMGAVDRSDQMVSYNSFQRKTLKWWKRCFFHMLSLSVVNAYILYKEWITASGDRTKPVLHRIFRRELVCQLLESCGPLPRGLTPRRQSAGTLLRLQGRHFPQKIVPTGKKQNVTRICGVCNPAEKKRLEVTGEKRRRAGKESSYECDQCKVALCVDPCFKLYHTNKDFVLAYSRAKGYVGQSTQSDSDEDD